MTNIIISNRGNCFGKGSIEDNGKAYNGDNEERSMPRLRHIATVVEGN